MTRPDEQLMDQVRQAVETAPPRSTHQLDKAVAVGRQRVRTRRVAAAGTLLGVGAVTGLLLSQGDLGPIGATAPAGGGDGPSVTLTSPPAEPPTRLYTALDDRLEAMGLPSDDVSWSSGVVYAPEDFVSAFSASTLSGLVLDTARAGSAVDMAGDLCGRQLDAITYFVVPGPGSGATAPDASPQSMACEQLSQPDGTQLLRVSGPGAAADGELELYWLELLHPEGSVRITPMSIGPDPRTRSQLTEEQLTEIVTDPALRW